MAENACVNDVNTHPVNDASSQVGTFHGRWGRTSWRVEEATNIVERVRLPNSVCKRGGRSFEFSPSDGAVLRVPPLSSFSSLRFCRIIDLGYRLDVVAKMSSAGSPKVKIPIKICSCRHHPHGTAQPSFATPCAAPQDSAQDKTRQLGQLEIAILSGL
ncbi:uncharacterized protein LOC118428823 [Branchiostoma floridae]|uniref:Uncharacterized protein LOC118428823 n=1 Tax=Branchiostoma floridae TaxID=7739 RepID=A0A9J7N8A1_BRAFL|nr:uncharacterized protein LOC118428823 [Branchiostoma floridae]